MADGKKGHLVCIKVISTYIHIHTYIHTHIHIYPHTLRRRHAATAAGNNMFKAGRGLIYPAHHCALVKHVTIFFFFSYSLLAPASCSPQPLPQRNNLAGFLLPAGRRCQSQPPAFHHRSDQMLKTQVPNPQMLRGPFSAGILGFGFHCCTSCHGTAQD